MVFSIITVCWNDLSGLMLTYQSVIEQSFHDYELVIVDGNSADGTKDYLKGNLRENVRWVSESDAGIFDAMNKGIEMAKGDYLIFMNSYDEFVNRSVLHELSKIVTSQDELKFLYGDSIDVTLEGENLYKYSREHSYINRGMFTSHQAMVFKSTKILYPKKFKYTADYAYVAKYLIESDESEIKKVDFPICKFKLGGTNETKRFVAIREDFFIRREVLKLSLTYCILFYVFHLIHTIMKRIIPNITRTVRYDRKPR